MRIGIIGCSGRMGKALVVEVHQHEECSLSGGVVRADSPFAGIDLGVLASLEPIGMNAGTHLGQLIEQSDAVIDFTRPETALEVAGLAAECGTALITGTTGFDVKQQKKLENYAQRIPVVWSANMSIGVNVLRRLVEKVASVLDESYDIEIVEMHHCHKVDAPSGTALALGESAAKGRGVALGDVACRARDGIIGPRHRGEIGFATLRGGDVIGEHTVIFAGDGERIELSHRASSRKIFAKGAVRAALWSKGKAPGFYSMHDVLGV